MSKYPTLLKQFRSFYFQNTPKDMKQAIEYFSVFGGMSWDIDMDRELIKLIEDKILKNYTYIHSDIAKVTKSDKIKHSLLSKVALGDARIHSAVKNARISKNEAQDAIDDLYDLDFIDIKSSLEEPLNGEEVDDKIEFSLPFMRFWFAFISPYFKSIKLKEYKEVKDKFINYKASFEELTFEALSKELLKKSFSDDAIVELGSYWDRDVNIDILAKSKSGKIIAGACKYSNSKSNKSELSKLKQKCQEAELTPDIYVLFSKGGFSSELKKQKGEDLKLYTINSFKALVNDLSKSDFIECVGKKY